METKDEIIEKIKKKTGKSGKEIQEMVKAKIEEYGGLLTEEGAAFSIAKDLKVKFTNENIKYIRLSELKKDMPSVNTYVIVKAAFPVREWSKGNRSGKVANLIVGDSTGDSRLVFWGSEIEEIEKGNIKPGTVLDVKDAYVKDNNGALELNLGSRGSIEINPELPSDINLPKVDEKSISNSALSTTSIAKEVKLSELTPGMKSVNTYARVVQQFPANSFEKAGKSGKVRNMMVFDGATRRLTLWNEKVDVVGDLPEGTILGIENGYTKEGLNNRVELHVGDRGSVFVNPTKAPKLPEVGEKREQTRVNINDLKGGETFTDIKATIVQAFPPRTFSACPKCGKKVDGHCDACDKDSVPAPILNLVVDDGTGNIRAALFRNVAEKMMGCTGADYAADSSKFDESKLLGEEKIFSGQVKKNAQFDRLEFTVREVKDVDAEHEMIMIKGK